MTEILAPCGGEDSLPAALNSGADAVYLGVSDFSARRNAKNFDIGQLTEAVRLCHRSGVRVYAAMNTLVFDDELGGFLRTAEQIAAAGTDAVIIQDPGAARLLKSSLPELKLHASTQMTVTSPAGAELLRRAGFSRVVLAREMSFSEIEDVIKKVDIETEVFVHGALCVCVSGQCLMSAMYGGRSANRGLCAQPCRLDHSCGGRHSVLSLKDLSLVPVLKELSDIGVTSAKIEGRMKRPEYVAASTAACRAVLDGKEPDMETLRAVFSRSGFTHAYYDGSMKDMQGVRTREDAQLSAEVLKKIKRLYEKPYKRYRLNIDTELKLGVPIKAHVSFSDIAFDIVSDIIPEKAENRAVSPEDIAERLKKLGPTIFEAGEIRCKVQDGLSVSASAVNSLRREITERASELLSENIGRKR